jgi:hypothetical protein
LCQSASLVNNVTGWRYILQKWKSIDGCLKYFFRNCFLCQQYKLFFFIGIYFFNFISNNNCRLLTTVQVFDIMFDNSAPLEMMNEWTPTFFLKYFYAGIVQSNLCWKIHNRYDFRVNIHIFVLKYLVQIQIIQNFQRR